MADQQGIQDLLAFETRVHEYADRLQDIPTPQAEVLSRIRSHLNQLFQSPSSFFPDINQTAEPNLFRPIIESITDGILTINTDWQITYINPRAAQNGFHEPQDLIGRNLWEAFPQLLGTEWETIYRRVMAERKSVQLEMKGVVRDSWYLINIYPSAEGMTILWLDNSVHKQMELELQRLLGENQRHKSLLEAIFEADPSGIAVLVGDELRFEYTNPAYRYICPDPIEDPIGKPYERVWPKRSKYGNRDRFHIVLATGQPFQLSGITHCFDDKTERIFTLQARRIEWDLGQPAVLLLLWDTTEQSQAQQQAERERAQLQAVLEALPVGVAILDDRGGQIQANPTFDQIWGGPRPAVQNVMDYGNYQAWWADTGNPLQPEEWASTRTVQQGETVLSQEIKIRRFDGSEAYVLNSAVPIRDINGQITGSVVAILDISERRGMETALRQALQAVSQSEAMLEAFFAHSPGILNIEDEDFRYIKTDPLTPTYFGLDRQSIVGLAVGDLAPEYIEEFGPMMRRVIETGQPEVNRDVFSLIPSRPGEISHWQASYFPVPLPDGKRGIGIMGVEITDLKKTEKALRESEQLYRAIGESINYGVWVCAPDGRNVYASPSFLNLVGITQQECSEFGWGDTLHPEDAERTIDAWKDCVRAGGIWDIEHRFLGGDGQYHPILARGVPVRNEQGEIIYWAGINLDIGRFKQTEQALRESEARYRMLHESMRDPFVQVDMQGRVIECNDLYCQMLGYSPEEVCQLTYQEITPERWHAVEAQIVSEQIIPRGYSDVYEKEYRRKDGTVFPVELRTILSRDAGGQPVAMWAIVRDITERKRTLEALATSEARYRELLESIQDGFFQLNRDWRFTYINPQAANVIGWEPAAIIGKNIWEIFPSTRGTEQERVFRRVMENRQPAQFEATGAITPNCYSLRVYPSQQGISVFWVDITERLRAEQALQESETQAQLQLAEMNAAFEGMSDALIIFDREGRAIRANRGAVNVYGIDPTDRSVDSSLKTRAIRNLSGEQVALETLPNNRALKGDRVVGEMYRLLDIDNQEHIILASASPIYNADGQLSGALVLWHDITERVQAEEHARETNARLEVQRRLIEQREQERLQIARDLHDGPVQELLGAMYALQGMLSDDETSNIADGLRSIAETLRQQAAELRDYAGNLRPPALSKFGLERAIRSHAESFQQKHPEIQITMEATQEGSLLPEEMRLALFRIYQEAMRNIARHSPKANVTIRFEKDDREARLEISDDGPGFEVPKDWLALARAGHLGLVGMRERAEAIGGQLEITAAPGWGTRIRATVPLKDQGQDSQQGSSQRILS